MVIPHLLRLLCLQAASRQPLSLTQPRYQSTFETPDNKRKISETSFGTRSTETTPQKLHQQEVVVQSLQNKFMDLLVNKLWLGKIDMPWVTGREMYMDYHE